MRKFHRSGDGPGVWLPPPVLYATGYAVALAVKALVTPPPVTLWWLWPVGAVLAGIGLALALWAVVTLHSHGTSVDPSRPASALVEAGPYRLTRNPIYLAMTTATVGVAIMTKNLWFVPALACIHVVLHYGVIKPEERHLAHQFKSSYTEYQRRTRRWL